MASSSTKRRLQFRLRSLLILMTIAAAGLAWLAYERRRIADRREALNALGTELRSRDDQPAWRVWLLGDDSPGYASLIYVNIAGLRLVESMSRLVAATFYVYDDTKVHLGHLSSLRRLESLNLSFARFADAELKHIAELPCLQELVLERATVNDNGVQHLARMAHLKGLYLDGTAITDKGLSYVGQLTGLKTLSLSSTLITDEGLVHLKRLKGLQTLYIDKTKVTPAGAAELKRALPDCEIILDRGCMLGSRCFGRTNADACTQRS